MNMVTDMATGLPPPDVKRTRLVGFMITGNQDLNTVLSPEQHRNLLELPGSRTQRTRTVRAGFNGVSTAQNMEFHQLPLF